MPSAQSCERDHLFALAHAHVLGVVLVTFDGGLFADIEITFPERQAVRTFKAVGEFLALGRFEIFLRVHQRVNGAILRAVGYQDLAAWSNSHEARLFESIRVNVDLKPFG